MLLILDLDIELILDCCSAMNTDLDLSSERDKVFESLLLFLLRNRLYDKG